ncbi:hypothetical protein CAP35_10405 [Chitinophagaceae bacterium IBVUCB1]|nr:hypothetical protein CAP35_10405 [Chitinophagaceae bacterium IBVUCB1]
MRFCIWIWIVLLCALAPASAQHPYFYQLKETENIIGSEIYSIRQDRQGYIWIAGNEGVFRYDGKQVKQYTNPKQNGKSISDLKEDERGRIWCKNFNGQIFFVSGDSLKIAVDVSKEYPTFPENTFGNDGVYYSIVGGVAHYNATTGKVRKWQYPADAKDVLASGMLLSKDGELYVSAIKSGIYKLSGNKLKKIDNTNSPLLSDIVFHRNFLFYLGNRLLMFTEKNPERAYYLSEVRNDSLIVLTQIPKHITGSRVFTCSPVGNDAIWLCTQEGAICVDADMRTMYNATRFFKDADVSNVMVDDENNYWFTTLDNGIYIVPNIDIWQYSKSSADITDDNVTAMYVNRNKEIMLGFFNGSIDLLRNGRLSHPVKPRQAVTMVRKIITDTAERHYIIAHGPVSYYDADNQRTSNMPIAGLRDVCYAGSNALLFASIQNAGWLQLRGSRVDSLHILKNKAARYVAYTTPDKLKWVGYSDGTYYYDTLNREHELLYNGQKVYATAMKTDNSGRLWIGTVSNGLMLVKNAKVIQHISAAGSLRGNNVRAIYCNDSLVWVATEKAFNIIHNHNGSVAYLDAHDGLPNAEIRQIYVDDETVYLATNKGLITLPANMKTINSIRPDIQITRLQVNDEERNVADKLLLKHNQNKLIIYFGAKGFTHKHQYSYSYMMKGLDTGWTYTDNNTDFARFNALPPGNYVFMVRAYNEDGGLSANTATIAISIAQPFWTTWWFYTLVGLFIIGTVSGIFFLRIRAINERNVLEQGIRSSQLSALKAQMNPHFVYNALNSIQDLVLQNDVRNANTYFSKFSTLMRKILDASGKDKISLQEELDVLELYLQLEKLRFGKQFEYTITVVGVADKDAMAIPAMAIQPFVENALKHGLLHKEGDKKLFIQFELKQPDTQLVCTITDNGIGRKKAGEINERRAKTHNSFAVQATQKRIDLLNKYYHGKIKLQIIDLGTDEQAAGTMVVLHLPAEYI